MASLSGSSLRVRLMLLVCLAIVPALGLALWAGLQYRDMVRDHVYDDLGRLAKLEAADTAEAFSDAELFLRSAATLPEVRDPDRAAASAFLAQLVSQYQAYLVVGVVKPNGDIVASSLPMHEPVNIRDRDYFQSALDRHTFAVGGYQVGRLTHKPGINCACPIFGPKGEVQGVVFVAVDPAQLKRPALRLDLPEGSTLTIVDRQGKVLYRDPDPDQWVGRSAADRSLVQHVMSHPGSDVLEAPGLDGVWRLNAYAHLTGAPSGIAVILGEPSESAFAQAERIMYRNLLALVIVALVALLGGMLGARAFVLRPVNALLVATRLVGAGDLTARGELVGERGELGELARAFDDMADALELRERERELAVEALHHEVDFITAVLGVADALVAVTDREGRIVRVNRSHERLTGHSAEECRGRPFWEIMIPVDPEHLRTFFAGAQAGQFPARDEFWFRVRNGERRLVAASITCLLDDNGEVEYIIWTGNDITDQRQAQDRLHLDDARLQALLTLSEMSEMPEQQITDFAMEAGVKLTRSTIGYLAFMSQDETVLTMHSWSKSAMDECAIIDKPIIYPIETTGLWGEPARQRRPVITNDYSAPDPLKKGYPAGHVQVRSHLGVPIFDGDLIIAIAGVGNKEEPYDESDVMQLRLLMDGMWRLLQRKRAGDELQASYDGLDRRVRDRTAELTDANAQLTLEVVERQRAEEKIAQQAEELTRSNAELERFAYVASHDLQEPLRKITAFGDRLKTKAGDALDDDARDYLDRMQGAAGRMHILINDLLSYARVTTRAQAFVPTNLGDVVREVLTDLEVTIEATGATVTAGDLPTLQADPVQMRQLFQNLLGNALKFRREGVPPVVTLSVDLLPPDSPDLPERESGRRYCQILIADNGIGFDEKFLERVFDVFQRLHSREEYPGTGIGLAICRKIVDRHGGVITAHSVPGEGSTFILTLPLGHGDGGAHP